MVDLGKLKAKRQGGALARIKERQNGSGAPEKAKGALGAMRARKDARAKRPALAALRSRRVPPPTKRAVIMRGMRFDNVRRSEHGDFWLLDVINGDKLVTFHNRYGAWFHDESNGADRGLVMQEPENCFAELRDESNPRWLTVDIFNYYVRELHHLGLPATQRDKQLLREKQETDAKAAEAEARKAKRQPKTGTGLLGAARKRKQAAAKQ